VTGPRLHSLLLGACALAGACQSGDKTGAPEKGTAKPGAVTATGPDGATLLSAELRNGSCAVNGQSYFEVTREGDSGAVTRGNRDTLRLEASRVPGDHQVVGLDGAVQLRVHRGEGRVDLLDASDIPVARIQLTAEGAKVVDRARAPVAALAKDGAMIKVTAPDGATLSTVSGTSDLVVAALLTAPGVTADARALLACDRLLTK
jgi:hypothetical protein